MQFIIEHKEALAVIILLLISEILPFSQSIKSNGIFELIVNLLKKIGKPKVEEISKE